MPTANSWRMFCSHGTVVFYIARHPGCTIDDIADALVVTRRTVWGLIGDLRRSGLLRVRREGKRNYYWVAGEARLPDPVLSHLTLRQIISALTA